MKVKNENEMLLYFYNTKRELADIKEAISNYRKKWKKEPTEIVFKEGTIIEYDGDLEVKFIKSLPKQHFLMRG